mmetsp:Transcript_19035/g.59066  ORF Transcript_19035/g.59066 Transcript_19035/m.59066 type:complete len:222 (-) Transcript_19035:20-685(-)|eukprot:CAMPEP_0174852774 /NCGR_PEP_ID=MMETSP1114-20130205/26716_1 /TAXON_ID=312471 /ORGANISM="Neobodo designis, Strain CCAP 1951/1" /LENGTH=221 /DNA_ID=CAMNT_0016087389 /DNA_START=221 /DNA_END=886 /DNA_ORIENTATION=-
MFGKNGPVAVFLSPLPKAAPSAQTAGAPTVSSEAPATKDDDRSRPKHAGEGTAVATPPHCGVGEESKVLLGVACSPAGDNGQPWCCACGLRGNDDSAGCDETSWERRVPWWGEPACADDPVEDAALCGGVMFVGLSTRGWHGCSRIDPGGEACDDGCASGTKGAKRPEPQSAAPGRLLPVCARARARCCRSKRSCNSASGECGGPRLEWGASWLSEQPIHQ